MVSFGNFTMIVSLCVLFHIGTLHGYFFIKTLAKFEFSARTSTKTCLKMELCMSLPEMLFFFLSAGLSENREGEKALALRLFVFI